jgi:hypothetical protein
MTTHPDPAMAEAIAEATRYGRARFTHADAETWWAECCAAVDAAAAALIEAERDPAALIRAAALAFADLADLLPRRAGPGQDVLSAICAEAPAGGAALERAGREAVPLLADAAWALHRRVADDQAHLPGREGEPVTRRMLRHLAELFEEAFTDQHGARARPSHGDTAKQSPFVRWLTVLLRVRAQAFETRHGFASPLPPEAVTPKAVRLALADPTPAIVWPGR